MRMVVPLHTVVRTQTVHLKCLHFIGCKLDICECVFLSFKNFWEIGLLGKYKWNICTHARTTERESRSVMSDYLQPHGLYSPWNSPGQNTGVGSHSLLQEIFPNQGSNPGLPHFGWILYQLSYQERTAEMCPKSHRWDSLAYPSAYTVSPWSAAGGNSWLDGLFMHSPWGVQVQHGCPR